MALVTTIIVANNSSLLEKKEYLENGREIVKWYLYMSYHSTASSL